MTSSSLKKILYASVLTIFIAAQTLYPFAARADNQSATQSPQVSAPVITVDMPQVGSQSPQASDSMANIPVTTVTTTTPATVAVVAPTVPATDATATSTQSADTAPVVIAPVTPPVTSVQSPAAASTTIATGDAAATANIVNIADTSITNSKGSIVLDNLTKDVTAPIDLRNYYAANDGAGASGNTCTLLSCAGGEGIAIKVADNTAINNTVVASATTGGNTINNATNATITSGNAYTGVNVLNLANTNIVGSNYLLTLINAFKNVNSDIVFPSLQSFFTDPASAPAISVTTADNGSIANAVSLNADSGNNQIAASNGGVIATGNAASTSSVFNQLNAVSLSNDSVSLLFKIHGAWNGSVVGLPSTLNIMQGDDGSIYISNNTTNADTAARTGGAVSINSDATALIHNDIALAALTGNNTVNNAANALITTGNAFAGANIANIANTSVVGKNWLFGITNIFGDFNGNIVFGRPDLFVAEKVDKPDVVTNNTDVTYTYDIKNNGDATATNVTLTDRDDAAHVVIDSSSVPYTGSNAALVFALGTMAPGATMQVTYHAHVANVNQQTTITDTATATETETDNNAADNTDSVSFTAIPSTTPAPAPTVTGGANAPVTTVNNGAGLYVPIIHVIRSTKDVTADSANRSAQEALIVKNDGVTLENDIVLHDIVRAPDGTVTNDEEWDVGTLAPGEEVDIAYEIDFNEQAAAGTYNIDTTLEGFRLNKETFPNNGTVTVLAGNEVLGAATALPKVMEYDAGHPALFKAKTLPASISLAPVIAYAAGQPQLEKPIGTGNGALDILIALSLIVLIVLLAMARKYYHEKNR